MKKGLITDKREISTLRTGGGTGSSYLFATNQERGFRNKGNNAS